MAALIRALLRNDVVIQIVGMPQIARIARALIKE